MSRLLKLSALTAIMTGTMFAQGNMSAQGNAELGQIQRVYVLPMSSSFDQYLANRLRSVASLRVVTDPTKADAYFTDRLGVAFENKLNEFDEKAKEMADAQKAVSAEKDPEKMNSEAAQKSFKLAAPITSSIGRGKGTYFLVDRQSRNIVWSIYQKPKDYQPKTLDDVAEKVVDEFKKDLAGRKQ